MELKALGLPPNVIEAYESAGVTQLHPWQLEALEVPGVTSGESNLVYTAPTSGGKSLVAEVLVIKRLLEGGPRAKAIFLLPYRSTVGEKTAHFRRVLKGTQIRVADYYAGLGALPVSPRSNLLVATLEKGALVVQSLAEQGRLSEIVAVVADEIHLVGDSARGATFERLLSKLVFWRTKMAEAACPKKEIVGEKRSSYASEAGFRPQIIGMSATLPNLDEMSCWLRAAQYSANARPTPLTESIVRADGMVLKAKDSQTGHKDPGISGVSPRSKMPDPEQALFGHAACAKSRKARVETVSAVAVSETVPTRSFNISAGSSDRDLDALTIAICQSITDVERAYMIPVSDEQNVSARIGRNQGRRTGGVLIFCPQRSECVRVARVLSYAIHGRSASTKEVVDAAPTTVSTAEPSSTSTGAWARSRRNAICEQIDAFCPDGTPTLGLAEVLLTGVAFHHAGLTEAERKLVESCFCEGLVEVITATSSLAAGINLPVRAVVFRSLRQGLTTLSVTAYRQMAGRAGRTGMCAHGDAYIIAMNEGEVRTAQALITSPLPSVSSPLRRATEEVAQLLVDCVTAGLVNDKHEVAALLGSTLLHAQGPREAAECGVAALRCLVNRRMLRCHSRPQHMTSATSPSLHRLETPVARRTQQLLTSQTMSSNHPEVGEATTRTSRGSTGFNHNGAENPKPPILDSPLPAQALSVSPSSLPHARYSQSARAPSPKALRFVIPSSLPGTEGRLNPSTPPPGRSTPASCAPPEYSARASPSVFSEWVALPLGRAAAGAQEGGVPLNEVVGAFDELENVRRRGIYLMHQDFHLLYLSVPQSPARVCANRRDFPVDWQRLRQLVEDPRASDSAHLRGLAKLIDLDFDLLEELALRSRDIDPAPFTSGGQRAVSAARWERLWHAVLLYLLITNAEPDVIHAIFTTTKGAGVKCSNHGNPRVPGRGVGQSSSLGDGDDEDREIGQMRRSSGYSRNVSAVAHGVPATFVHGSKFVDAGVFTEFREGAARRAGDLERFCDRIGESTSASRGSDLEISLFAASTKADVPRLLQDAERIGEDSASWGTDGGGQSSWWILRELLRGVRDRLWSCVRQELLPLFRPRLAAMTPTIASALFKAGYRQVDDLASANIVDLAVKLTKHSRRGRAPHRHHRAVARELIEQARDAAASEWCEDSVAFEGENEKHRRKKARRPSKIGSADTREAASEGPSRLPSEGPIQQLSASNRCKLIQAKDCCGANDGHGMESKRTPQPAESVQSLALQSSEVSQNPPMWFAERPPPAHGVESMAAQGCNQYNLWSSCQPPSTNAHPTSHERFPIGLDVQPINSKCAKLLGASISDIASPGALDVVVARRMDCTNLAFAPGSSHDRTIPRCSGVVGVGLAETALQPVTDACLNEYAQPPHTPAASGVDGQVSRTACQGRFADLPFQPWCPSLNLDEFRRMLSCANRYAIALDVKLASRGGPKAWRSTHIPNRPPFHDAEILGAAFCMEPPNVYYLPLSQARLEGGAHTPSTCANGMHEEGHAATNGGSRNLDGLNGGSRILDGLPSSICLGTISKADPQAQNTTGLALAWDVMKSAMTSSAEKVMYRAQYQLALLALRGVRLGRMRERDASLGGECEQVGISDVEGHRSPGAGCASQPRREQIHDGGAVLLDPHIGAWMLSPAEEPPQTLEAIARGFLTRPLTAMPAGHEDGREAAHLPRTEVVLLPASSTEADHANRRSRLFLEARHADCCAEVLLCAKVMPSIESRLVESSLLAPFKYQEMRLVPVLARMETAGLRVDMGAIRTARAQVVRALRCVDEAGRREAGRRVRWDSPKDIAALLYDELGLTTSEVDVRSPCIASRRGQKRRRTSRKTHLATGGSVLRNLAQHHPLPMLVMHHRRLSHTLASIASILKYAQAEFSGKHLGEYKQIPPPALAAKAGESGAQLASDPNRTLSQLSSERSPPVVNQGSALLEAASDTHAQFAVHCFVRQTKVSTGRLSTEQPNLQGLPHDATFPCARRFLLPENGSINDEVSDALLPYVLPRGTRVCVALPNAAEVSSSSLAEPGATPPNVRLAHDGSVGPVTPRGVALPESNETEGTSAELDSTGVFGMSNMCGLSGTSKSWTSGGPSLVEAILANDWPQTDSVSVMSNHSGIGKPTSPLADWWAARGHFEYQGKRGHNILQVPVRLVGHVATGPSETAAASTAIDVGNRILGWPSDRVWRVHTALCVNGWERLRPPRGARLLNDGANESTAVEGATMRRTGAGGQSVQVSLRSAFLAREGCVYLSIDYSQIEMRLMAHFCRDEALLHAIQSSTDLFTSMAATLFSRAHGCQSADAPLLVADSTSAPSGATALHSVTPAERARAKATAYAILYCAGPKRLVSELGISRTEAKRLIDAFHTAFPGVGKFASELLRDAKRDGFVTTIGGRRRWLPCLASRNTSDARRAERQCINTLCQGSAADLIKQVMITIDSVLVGSTSGCRDGQAELATYPAGGGGQLPRSHTFKGRMLLQVHDELLFEVEEGDAAALSEAVVRVMVEGITQLSVPLRVVVKKGASLGTMECIHEAMSQPNSFVRKD